MLVELRACSTDAENRKELCYPSLSLRLLATPGTIDIRGVECLLLVMCPVQRILTLSSLSSLNF